MTELVVNMPNTELEKVDKVHSGRPEGKDFDENICEICFGNNKCDKYKCGECDNKICIECAESWSRMVANNKEEEYSVRCPFCRNRNVYKYDDLTNEEYKVFYINLRKRLAELKKPLWEQQKYCEKYCDDLQYVRYWARRQIEDPKLRCDKKFYENIHTEIKKIVDNKYEVLDGDKIHRDYTKAVVELEELKDNKRLYDSCKAYNDTIRTKLLKQQNTLDKQSEMMRNMERQNELLLQQNRDLFSRVNDIYNIVKDKPSTKGEIKKIANNIKEVIDNTRKQYPININIVLE
jgi:hypothetical protein